MAEEENGSIEEGEDLQEEKKGSSKKKFIIIGVIFILLGGGGFAGWKFFLAEKFSSNDESTAEMAEGEPEESESSIRIIHEMKPFIVNLLGGRGKRALPGMEARSRLQPPRRGEEDPSERIRQGAGAQGD